MSRLQDEAERREEAIPEGRVEIDRETINSKTEPIYATTEEDLAQQFDRPPLSGKFAEAYRILGIKTVLYLDHREELASMIRDQAAARAEARRIARVDELGAEAKRYVERVQGAIAMLDTEIPDRVEEPSAGLRELARRGTRA